MKCKNCRHKMSVLENKHLNFFYIGCKKCNFSIPMHELPGQRWFKTKAEASEYKKTMSIPCRENNGTWWVG